ncbi:class I SAM-dependent methyltransferase [Actinophytocola sp.]|uniref:class I SAM-dependent methyltransferase n=1 Tax=Actinophytocola sp. TaxID=1872138 RepID=UPI002D6D61A5|nr:class I SAM-dependent methyltransferase [Actinophytocola sp.]HYQ68853.1 class I SAM-dependent methyltransferase [Actinophytocola sp.]
MAQVPPFDRIGKRYDESFVERDAQVAEGEWLVGRLTGPARVLDLGCGSGLPTARQLVDAGLDVVGVDESAAMLRLAERHAPGGRYLRRDMRDVADLGEFDAIVAFFALIMLPRRDILPLLTQLRGQLRGPRLLQVAMVLGDFDELPISFLGVPATATAYPPDELAGLVERAGFAILEVNEVRAEAERNRLEVQIYLRARAT